MKTIKEIKTNLQNNESKISKGVYLTKSNEYFWMTYTKSGYCKKLQTAIKKAGF